MHWLNEPPKWDEADGVLNVTTGDKTDFWRETHYGFIRDSGHFHHQTVEGDFTATLAFRGHYETLYDQAGMMIRLDEGNWIKAGIEYVNGRQMLSVVVTRDFSDWSTMPIPEPAEWVRLRLSRRASAVEVEWAPGESGSQFQLLRLAYLPARESALAGPMCCSPQRGGFRVEFKEFTVRPAAAPEAHS